MNYEPIAIIGYGVMYPSDSFSNESFWENIVQGNSGIREVTAGVWRKENYFSQDHDEADKTYCKTSGYLDKMPKLDKLFAYHGLDKREIGQLNRNQELVLHTIFQALDNGNLTLKDVNESAILIANMLGDLDICNFTLAAYAQQYLEDVAQISLVNSKVQLEKIRDKFIEKVNQKFIPKNIEKQDLVAHNLSEKIVALLNLKQESMVIDGACSGSVVAIDEAIKLIHTKQLKTCIVSGVLGNMGVTGNVAFSKIGGLSSSFAKPLDKNNDGLTPGE